MKKDRSSKVIEILALIVAVVGLSMGFAAYSSSFDVVEEAHVKPGDDIFRVIFSSSKTNTQNKKINGVAIGGAKAGTAFLVDYPSLTVANLRAYFTEPGQKVTYTVYSHNRGDYDAYLTAINYFNVVGRNSSKICGVINSSSATRELVNNACDDISLTVEIGDIKAGDTITNIRKHRLAIGRVEPIVITLEYSKTGTIPDGEFFVEFGNVAITYVSKYEDEHDHGHRD